jgi:hypothetical protein
MSQHSSAEGSSKSSQQMQIKAALKHILVLLHPKVLLQCLQLWRLSSLQNKQAVAAADLRRRVCSRLVRAAGMLAVALESTATAAAGAAWTSGKVRGLLRYHTSSSCSSSGSSS